MKSILFSLLFLLFSFAQASETVVINMKSLSFDPKTIQITAGQQVVWKNTALTDHTATSNDKSGEGGPLFDTGPVHPGKTSKDVPFNTPGTYVYQCAIHGKTMTGTITVKSSAVTK